MGYGLFLAFRVFSCKSPIQESHYLYLFGMRVFFTLLQILLFGISFTFCQEVESKKSILFEAGGTAGIASISYENIFTDKHHVTWLWRIGVSGFPIDKNGGIVIIIPASIGGIIGQNNHNFEFGIGQ